MSETWGPRAHPERCNEHEKHVDDEPPFWFLALVYAGALLVILSFLVLLGAVMLMVMGLLS